MLTKLLTVAADTVTDAAAEGAANQGEMMMGPGSLMGMMLPFVMIFGVMYFLMIRPQKKKEKAQKEMRENIQIGDEVTTIGGIVGIVVRKTEDTVVIETGGDRSKIRVKTWAISENATIHDEAG